VAVIIAVSEAGRVDAVRVVLPRITGTIEPTLLGTAEEPTGVAGPEGIKLSSTVMDEATGPTGVAGGARAAVVSGTTGTAVEGVGGQ